MAETYRDDSADTARFQAFADRRPDDDLPAPWRMRADRNKIAILLGCIVAVVILGWILGKILGA